MVLLMEGEGKERRKAPEKDLQMVMLSDLLMDLLMAGRKAWVMVVEESKFLFRHFHMIRSQICNNLCCNLYPLYSLFHHYICYR